MVKVVSLGGLPPSGPDLLVSPWTDASCSSRTVIWDDALEGVQLRRTPRHGEARQRGREGRFVGWVFLVSHTRT